MSYIELPVLSGGGAGFTTDGQGLLLDGSNVLSLVLNGTSLAKSALGLKFNDASPQFIDVSSSTTAFRVTQKGTGAALLIEDSTNPDSTPFVIDSNGNVGIGTTNPATGKMRISGGNLLIDYGNGIKFNHTTGTTGDFLLHGSSSSAGMRMAVSSDSSFQRPFEIGHYTNDDVSSTWNSKFYVNSYSGNVGIGTTSPQATLDVNGTVRASSFVATSGASNFSAQGINNVSSLSIGTTTTGTDIFLGSGADRTMSVQASATAGNSLTVQAGGTSATTGDINGGNLVLSSGAAYGTGTSQIQFRTASGGAPATSMTILGNGNVGIGTSTPGSALHLAQANGVAESGTCLFAEKDTTPGNPTDGTQVKMYMKADKIIFQYNDGGTVRYKYLDLTGTTDTWTATTTAP